MHVLDSRIATPLGELFATQWTPATVTHPEPIVLFHDSLGRVRLWRDFPEQLATATQRRVIAYDRLGYGQSDSHPSELEPSFVRDEAKHGFAAVRAHFGLDQYVLFGHSIGGGMAIACAAADPAACRAVVVESSQLFVEAHTLDGIRAAEAFFAQPGQVDRLGKYHGDKASWALHAWIGMWFSAEFADYNLDHELAQIRCPVLALYGDQDEYGTLAHPARMDAHLRTPMTLEVLSGCGHFPHRERGDDVAHLTAEWLARNAR